MSKRNKNKWTYPKSLTDLQADASPVPKPSVAVVPVFTQGDYPLPADTPLPPTGAGSVALSVQLSWAGGTGATAFKVYFGTNPASLSLVQTGSGTTYTASLSPGLTYYWRVDGVNSRGTTTGTLWSFTSLSAPAQATPLAIADGATGVSKTPTLTWTPGAGASSHNVFFGTSNPPASIGNQPGNSYTPGTLTPGTTYYWRINEVNAVGPTIGPVWSFTVLDVPAKATLQSPVNAGTSIDPNADLGWLAGARAVSHDVYLGTNQTSVTNATTNSPEYKGNQATTIYDPGALTANTTYYWRIDEVNGSGTTKGDIWSFTTAAVGNVGIQGTVLNRLGAATQNLLIKFTGTGGSSGTDRTMLTDVNGFYSATVPSGWSGTITTTNPDVSMNPASITLTNVTTAQLAQNFVSGACKYVDGTNGNDSNPGTFALPYKTVRKTTAVAPISPGDWVFIRGGTSGGNITYNTTTYPNPDSNSTAVLSTTVDGLANLPILFRNYPGEYVIFDGRAVASDHNDNTVLISHDYTTVYGIKFINCRQQGGKIFATYREAGVSQSSFVDGSGVWNGPVFEGDTRASAPTGRKITGSHFKECVADTTGLIGASQFVPAIQVIGKCTDCSIEYCRATAGGRGVILSERDSLPGTAFRSWPTYASNWPDAVKSCQIIGCIAHDNVLSVGNTDGVGGRYATDCTYKDNISFRNIDDNLDTIAASRGLYDGNICFDADPTHTAGNGCGHKICTRGGGGNIVRNCISFLNDCRGFDDADGCYNLYHNNVAYRNGTTGVAGSGALRAGFVVESNIFGPNSFLNNISYLNLDGDIIQSNQAIAPSAGNPAQIGDYNYWGDGVPPPHNDQPALNYEGSHSKAFGANTYGLAAVGDPLFVNPPTTKADIDTSAIETALPGNIQAAGDTFRAAIRALFALQDTSPCRNAGVNPAPYYQFGSPPAALGSAYDMGAVERS